MKTVMKLVLSALLAFALVSPAAAYFEDYKLVQVAMSADDEVAVDLGAMDSLQPGTLSAVGSLSLSQFQGVNSWDDITLSYMSQVFVSGANANIHLTIATTSTDIPVLNQSAFSNAYGGMNALMGALETDLNTTTLGAGVKSLKASDGNSYTTRLGQAGGYAGLLPAADGNVSLAGLETVGYVDMYLYDYNAVTQVTDALGTLRLHVDGHTELLASGGNPVPVPAAVWMLGSGLVGLVGIRRKK